MNNRITLLILLTLIAGCVTNEVKETTTSTSSTTTTTTTTSTTTTDTTTPETKLGCEQGCGCLTPEEAGNQSLCGKKLLCGFNEQKKPKYCYQTTTTTLPEKILTCKDYCLRNRYIDGICRLNGFDCHRIGGKNEKYEPLGDKYCPRGQPDDACCCIIKE